MSMILTEADAAEIASVISDYGSPVTISRGIGAGNPPQSTHSVAILEENQSEVARIFPLADFADMQGRTALFYFDGGETSLTLQNGSIVADKRTGIRWEVKAISDQAFPLLLLRIALVAASPMTR